ncbi:hypothetical protein [Hymenobacter rigui]|uniref:Uncharacterized protein n=1 Tax=Hymenobacter rigui TaxID=334424 RepID=A0A3R9P5T1_9BACT|nr:hypothetical protein [Hymenobacter rigui]RSK50862.1 hypothetical protein EI291_00645 [Hymenobacter rigui]
MQQYSCNGEPIELEILTGHLLFIDPLYLENIREESGNMGFDNATEDPAAFLQLLENEFFPYGGGCLLGFKNVFKSAGPFRLSVEQIQRIDGTNSTLEQLSVEKKITAFSSDFGACVILDLVNFSALLQLLTIEDIIDATESDFPLYQERINRAIGNKGWAYIQNPGIENGFGFAGSGSYIVID